MVDSKSTVRNNVAVRVRPSVPYTNQIVIISPFFVEIKIIDKYQQVFQILNFPTDKLEYLVNN